MPRESARGALLRSVGTEIRVHLLVYMAIGVPTVALALPVLISTFATHAVFQSVGSLWHGTKDPRVSVAYGWLTFSVALLLLSRFAAGCRRAITADLAVEEERSARMRPPKGATGALLIEAVDGIWSSTPDREQAAPEVVWYSSFQVAAHARSVGGHSQVCVSSALWDRVAKRDPTAELILAHELGHVVHRDWRTFRRLSVVLHGIRAALKFSKQLTVGATAVTLLLMGVAEAIHGSSLWTVARLELAGAAIAALSFLLLSVADLFLRRYASFVVALMEVRADLSAALWTVGLDGFARIFESDASLRRSTAADLRQSFFSPDMTHISESERLALIRTPDRLFTPKLRYFAWSVVLALLIPLNPVTPLMYGGAIDQVVIVATSSALYATVMAMLVLSGYSRAVTWRRCAVLAAAVCLALASTSVNLYDIGYLLTHYSLAIANDVGLGGKPITLSEVWSDLAITAGGLGEKAIRGVSGWWLLLTLPATMALMKAVRPTVRLFRPQPHKAALALPAATATFLTAIAAGRDESRSMLYDEVAATFPDAVLGLWPYFVTTRLALPAMVGLLAILVWAPALKTKRNTT